MLAQPKVEAFPYKKYKQFYTFGNDLYFLDEH